MSIDVADRTRVVCYCADCRAIALAFGGEGDLDVAGGVDLVNITPDRITLVRGRDALFAVRVSPRGPLRWVAGCCDTVMCSCAPRRGVPIAFAQTARITPEGAAGKVRARVNTKSATGKVPRGGGGVFGLLTALVRRTLAARFSGAWQATPFFDERGQPIAVPRLLSDIVASRR